MSRYAEIVVENEDEVMYSFNSPNAVDNMKKFAGFCKENACRFDWRLFYVSFKKKGSGASVEGQEEKGDGASQK